jgi:hypothetical protein
VDLRKRTHERKSISCLPDVPYAANHFVDGQRTVHLQTESKKDTQFALVGILHIAFCVGVFALRLYVSDAFVGSAVKHFDSQLFDCYQNAQVGRRAICLTHNPYFFHTIRLKNNEEIEK